MNILSKKSTSFPLGRSTVVLKTRCKETYVGKVAFFCYDEQNKTLTIRTHWFTRAHFKAKTEKTKKEFRPFESWKAARGRIFEFKISTASWFNNVLTYQNGGETLLVYK